MFKIKAPDGTNNLCGKTLARLRAAWQPPLSQRGLAKELQLRGFDVDNHFIRRIENGERFVTDIEIQILSDYFGVSVEELLGLVKSQDK